MKPFLPARRPTRAPYDRLYDRLCEQLPGDRVITDRLRLLAYGTDASFYRLVPQIVVVVESEDEVVSVLSLTAELGVAVTFRAAGTSLSGQAVSDSVLVVLGDGWTGSTIAEDGSWIAVQPGVIGAEANRRLAPFGRKIGPDPASINAAKIGGIAANNASGMCCGTAQNSYQTLQSLRLVLADGTRLDTADAASRAAFQTSHADLLARLSALANEAKSDDVLASRIRRKYAIKNTTGYSLNALVDFDDPIDILAHLLIGSEGTLAFLSEITYRTVIEHPFKATALILYGTVSDACHAVPLLGSGPVDAVELIDRAGLRAVQDKPGMPEGIARLGPQATALLVETRAATLSDLQRNIRALELLSESSGPIEPVVFTHDPQESARLWSVRKGLFPSVGAVRQAGTTVIIEDVAFRVVDLAHAVRDLHLLFDRHGYREAIIFGHALAGNMHFVFTQAFDTQNEIDRYAAFMEDVCDLVVGRYEGSLKAEHGTGRNMAPFVELEWGRQAYALMKEVKQILDPSGMLNPGVLLNEDPRAHVTSLKAMPAVMPADLGAVVNTCIECGFCEPKCPSHGLTLSPRQRITARREISRLQADSNADAGKTDVVTDMEQLYAYAGTDTCAACGLCATACPVGIDTGEMIKRLRGQTRTPVERKVGQWAARHFATALAIGRMGLQAGHLAQMVIGQKAVAGLSAAVRRWTGGATPLWSPAMPTVARYEGVAPRLGLTRLVYFPSCGSRTFGPQADDPAAGALPDRFLELCARAGIEVIMIEKDAGLCCGMPFESKGLFDQANDKSTQLEQALQEVSENGTIPIAFDTSPCALRMRRVLTSHLPILDVAEVAHDILLPRLEIQRREREVAVHLTCSTRRMGVEDKVLGVARVCAKSVIVPPDVGCCGFAGDKGFSRPELNQHALRSLKAALPVTCSQGVSTSRTCEIGLSAQSGLPYRSIIHLLEWCTR